MDRRRRASSAASNRLLSRQLASITDTLAKASQRRDEELKRACRPSKACTAATNSASPTKPTVPVQEVEPSEQRSELVGVHLRGGGDDKDPYPTNTGLEKWEKAEEVRKERKDFERTVVSSGPDDPERQKMVKYLVARSRVAKVAEDREVERKRLEEEEEAVDEAERVVKREEEVEEFEKLLLKEEEDMENEDYEERVRLWEEGRRLALRMKAKEAARDASNAFLIKTAYKGQFEDPGDEKAELKRLEEEIFEYLVAKMEAEDAGLVWEERKRQRLAGADEDARKKVKADTPNERLATPGSAGEQGQEHLEPATAQLRGGATIDEVIAAAAETAEDTEDAEAERKRKIDKDFQEMMVMMKALDAEREAREEKAGNRALRKKAAQISGYARDEEFERMIDRMEEEDTKRLGEKIRQTEEVKRKSAEDAAREIRATEEARRRTESTAERSYLLPPEDPPKDPPPSYEASMRGGEASPLGDDPRALLAELCSLRGTTSTPEAQNNDMPRDNDDFRQMLAEFNRSFIPVHATTAAYDDPRQMLTELALLSAPGHRDMRSPTNGDHEDDEDDDINMLQARLDDLRSSFKENPSSAPALSGFDLTIPEAVTTTTLGSEIIPNVVALELEHSDCQWEQALGRTKRLFSSGLDSYEAQKEKEVAVAHAEEALQDIITSVMEVEEDKHRKAEKTKLQRRLIVSNLAAGADAEEMERQFWKYRYDIADIILLPNRDPLKRTQTAYVDFSSRKAAIQASYISGQVYGLIFDVKLVVPVE